MFWKFVIFFCNSFNLTLRDANPSFVEPFYPNKSEHSSMSETQPYLL